MTAGAFSLPRKSHARDSVPSRFAHFSSVTWAARVLSRPYLSGVTRYRLFIGRAVEYTSQTEPATTAATMRRTTGNSRRVKLLARRVDLFMTSLPKKNAECGRKA